MDVDAVDSVGDAVNFFDSDEIADITNHPLWFGREITLSMEKNLKLQFLAQFFFANSERIEQVLQLENGLNLKNHYFGIDECKNLLKADVKALRQRAKKVEKASKKAAKSTKKVVDFVKKHPKEAAIVAAVAVV